MGLLTTTPSRQAPSTSFDNGSVFLFPMGCLQNSMSLPVTLGQFTHANRWDTLIQLRLSNWNHEGREGIITPWM